MGQQITYRAPRSVLVSAGGVELHVRDMAATFAADVTLGAAQEALAKHGQWLPIDGDPELAIGKLVERNSTGPLRAGYGGWRDVLLGVQFVNGKTELITVGGLAVKNVAGYDVGKFMVGQWGVFGRIMTVTTRTYRRPAGAVVARFPAEVGLIGKLLPTKLRPHWAVVKGADLYCGYLGDRATIRFYLEQLPSQEPMEVAERTLAEDVEHRAGLWRSGAKTGEFAFRASVPPAKVLDFSKAARPIGWVADPVFGVVLASCSEGQMRHVRGTAASMGGTVVFTDPAGASPVNLMTNPVEQRVLEALKRAFDPGKTLQPLPVRAT